MDWAHDALELPGLTSQAIAVDTGATRFDLTLFLMADGSGGYTGGFEFDTDLFDAVTVERWVTHYCCLLKALTEAPEGALADLPVLDSTQTQQVIFA